MIRENYTFKIFTLLTFFVFTFFSIQYYKQVQNLYASEVIPTTDLDGHSMNIKVSKSNSDSYLELRCQTDDNFNGTITIFNLIGKEISQWNQVFTPGKQDLKLDVSQLVAGQYMVAVSNGEESVAKKFILHKHKHP